MIMAMVKTSIRITIRRGIAAFMGLALVGSVVAWIVTGESLPKSSRVATGAVNGVFHQLGEALGAAYHRQTERALIPDVSDGSVSNRERLIAGEVDVAMIQGGSVPMEGLAVIAPLYPELVHVIARRELGIDSIGALDGKRVVLGPLGSGMRKSASHVLKHYQIYDSVVDMGETYFYEAASNPSIDAAIVTTGIFNHDLGALLSSHTFETIPIDSAGAIEAKFPYFQKYVIPKGLYRSTPPAPEADVQTVGTLAFLVVREDASDKYVGALLRALYEENVAYHFPNLIRRDAALESVPVPLHPEARRYFNPPDEIGALATILETLVATKELLLAFGAGAWLLWDRWRRVTEAEEKDRVMRQKDYLDSFLERTFEIERAQMRVNSPQELERFLDQVTMIKLQALRELTHEELRSDQTFAIFLAQCANLINKIQFKIQRGSGPMDES